MSARCYDVAVIGGGPAGLAAAAAAARQGRSVVLFEMRAPGAFRVGETLGAEVGPLLAELGALDAVSDALGEQAPFLLVRSSWGSDELVERSSIFHPLGAGWHVDRACFDEALAAWARSLGVEVRGGVGRCAVVRDGEGFSVRPKAGDVVVARRVVDASGRGATGTAALGGRRWLAADRQVALLARLGPGSGSGPGLLLEAVEDGFWYSAPLSDGALVVVLLTDADVLTGLGRDRGARYRRALARSTHTAERVATHGAAVEHLAVFRSDSGRLVPDRGVGWRAVGDAAMATDPLGGNGVARALRSALEVAAAPEAAFDGGLAGRRFGDFLDTRARYCWVEGRWPHAPFWARRRPAGPDGEPAAWLDVPLTLEPEATLRWVGDAPPAAEAWLPPVAVAASRAALEAPAPAHQVLAELRRVAPIGDRRLLVGLQWLCASGVVDVVG